MVVAFYFAGKQRPAQEVFEGIGDAVEELEDLEGFGVARRGAEEEQLVLDDGVEEGRRIRVGEVYERGSRRRVS